MPTTVSLSSIHHTRIAIRVIYLLLARLEGATEREVVGQRKTDHVRGLLDVAGAVIGGETVPVLRLLLPIIDEGTDSEETDRPILHFIGQRRILPVLASRHRLAPETVHVARHLIHESQPFPSQR